MPPVIRRKLAGPNEAHSFIGGSVSGGPGYQIYAPTLPAKMVQLQPAGTGTNEGFKSESVSPPTLAEIRLSQNRSGTQHG